MVHIGAVDAPVSVGDITNIAAEFRKAIGTGKDAPATNGVVLGWDFAFEMNEVALQQAARANIQMRFLRIPRDALDKRAVEQGDIHFFELAALSVDMKVKKNDVALRLTDFVIPPDDVPEEARRTVKHWSQWIDYWAVDWDNKGDTFHNEWQAVGLPEGASDGIHPAPADELFRPDRPEVCLINRSLASGLTALGEQRRRTARVYEAAAANRGALFHSAATVILPARNTRIPKGISISS